MTYLRDGLSHAMDVPESERTGVDQLTSMAKLACTEMGIDKLTEVADRGYYSDIG
jgi:hypothetical protein